MAGYNKGGTVKHYKSAANIRVEFYDTQALPKGENLGAVGATGGSAAFKLCGFLTDDGLTLDYKNKFNPSLDLAGGILGQFNDLVTSSKGLWDSLAKRSGGVRGYVGLGSNASLILNAPYYWQGTDPINFKLSVYQVADYETEIIKSYRRVLECVSPEGGPGISIGKGPMLINVHYFPVSSDGSGDAENGTGKIVFKACLCHNVNMQIKPPYSMQFEPLIGIYTFDLMVSRIISRDEIKKIFEGGA